MIPRIIAAPFFFCLCFFAYQTFTQDESYAPYMIPCVVALVILYLFSPQLDWWWYRRNPPELPEQMRLLLQKHYIFYKNLSSAEKKRFRNRMKLYLIANEFKPVGIEKLPEDVKGFIAAAATQVSFGKEDYLMAPFEHIIIYTAPFPSPQYPEHFHTSEIYEEDGVIMFAANALMQGVFQNTYSIGLHEYAKVFAATQKVSFPDLPQDIWEKLHQVSRISKQQIEKYINIPDLEARPVSIHHFLKYPKQFQAVLPALFESYMLLLNLNPLDAHSPLINPLKKPI